MATAQGGKHVDIWKSVKCERERKNVKTPKSK